MQDKFDLDEEKEEQSRNNNRAFSQEQLEYISRVEEECLTHECDDTGHNHE